MVRERILRGVKPIIEKFPRVASTYRYFRDSSIHPKPEKINKGFWFSGNEVMAGGNFEPEETELIEGLLKDADVFVNVGANVGYYCCISLQHGVKTLAFEPIDTNLKYLYANMTANGWKEIIEVYPVAVGSSSGLIDIFGGGTGASLVEGWAGNISTTKRTVPIFALDDLLAGRFEGEKVLFLVDIEGAESAMLDGAASQLNRRPRSVWMVEISVTEHQPAGVTVNPNLLSTFERFWENGYEAVTANREMRLVSPDEVVRISEGGEDTLRTHNFLFR